MKFRVEEVNERPMAFFDDEPAARGRLLTAFLEEARTGVQDFLDEIERVRGGGAERGGYTGNGVDVEFYGDRAVIEELYPAAGEEAEPERVEIPLGQARRLLLDWRAALERWRARRSG